MTNVSGSEGGGIWLDDDFQMDSCTITGNKAKGAGGVYIAPASHDGASYISSIIKLCGEMCIAENEGSCSGMYIGEGTYANLTSAGLTGQTKMDVALAKGVLTNTLFGAYNYEGGNGNYVVTCGDRSITDPEPVPQTPAPETPDATTPGDTTAPGAEAEGQGWILWAGIGAAVVVAAVAAVLVLLKKKNTKK